MLSPPFDNGGYLLAGCPVTAAYFNPYPTPPSKDVK